MYIHSESRCKALFMVTIYGRKFLQEVIGKDKDDCIRICKEKYNEIELLDYEIEWLY